MPRAGERGRGTCGLSKREDERCRALGQREEAPRAGTYAHISATGAWRGFRQASLTLRLQGCESPPAPGLCREPASFADASAAQLLSRGEDGRRLRAPSVSRAPSPARRCSSPGPAPWKITA